MFLAEYTERTEGRAEADGSWPENYLSACRAEAMRWGMNSVRSSESVAADKRVRDNLKIRINQTK